MGYLALKLYVIPKGELIHKVPLGFLYVPIPHTTVTLAGKIGAILCELGRDGEATITKYLASVIVRD